MGDDGQYHEPMVITPKRGRLRMACQNDARRRKARRRQQKASRRANRG